MDFAALKRKIEAAAREAFTEMVRLHKDEGIYAFALYSDEGAMTVCPSTNTLPHLAEQDEGDGDLYFKFTPAEWKYEMQGADAAFDEISTLAREYVLSIGEEEEGNNDEIEDNREFTAFQHGLYEACIEVLEKLKQEGFFRKALGQDVFLTFEVSDHDMEEDRIRKIITRLNDGRYRDEYLAWMKTWDA